MCSLLTFTLPCPEKMAQGKAHFWLNVSFNWICNAVALLIISCCAIHVEMPNLTAMNLWISDPCDTMLDLGGVYLNRALDNIGIQPPVACSLSIIQTPLERITAWIGSMPYITGTLFVDRTNAGTRGMRQETGGDIYSVSKHTLVTLNGSLLWR